MTKNARAKKDTRARMQTTGENYTTAARNIDKPYLLTGPTGSGKSTQLTEHFDPALLLFGSDRSGRPINWDTSKANLVISGPSGSGKTNTIHVLMAQAAMRGYDIALVDFYDLGWDDEHTQIIERARSMGSNVEVLTGANQWDEWTARAGKQSLTKPLMVFVDEVHGIGSSRLERLREMSLDASFDIFLVSAGQKNAPVAGDHEIRFYPRGQFDRGMRQFEATFATGDKKTVVRVLPSIRQPDGVRPGQPLQIAEGETLDIAGSLHVTGKPATITPGAKWNTANGPLHMSGTDTAAVTAAVRTVMDNASGAGFRVGVIDLEGGGKAYGTQSYSQDDIEHLSRIVTVSAPMVLVVHEPETLNDADYKIVMDLARERSGVHNFVFVSREDDAPFGALCSAQMSFNSGAVVPRRFEAKADAVRQGGVRIDAVSPTLNVLSKSLQIAAGATWDTSAGSLYITGKPGSGKALVVSQVVSAAKAAGFRVGAIKDMAFQDCLPTSSMYDQADIARLHRIVSPSAPMVLLVNEPKMLSAADREIIMVLARGGAINFVFVGHDEYALLVPFCSATMSFHSGPDSPLRRFEANFDAVGQGRVRIDFSSMVPGFSEVDDEAARIEKSRCQACRDIITPDEDAIAFEDGYAHEGCVTSGE